MIDANTRTHIFDHITTHTQYIQAPLPPTFPPTMMVPHLQTTSSPPQRHEPTHCLAPAPRSGTTATTTTTTTTSSTSSRSSSTTRCTRQQYQHQSMFFSDFVFIDFFYFFIFFIFLFLLQGKRVFCCESDFILFYFILKSMFC